MVADEATQSSAPKDHVAEQTNVDDVSATVAGDNIVVDPRA